MSDCCPHCGHPLGEKYLPPAGVNLSAQELSVYQRVARRGATGASTAELISNLYGHRSDGGPDAAEKCVHLAVHRINKRVSKHHQEIVATQGRYVLRTNLLPISDLSRSARDAIIMRSLRRHVRHLDLAIDHNVSRLDVSTLIRSILGPRKKKLVAGKLSPSATEVRGIWPTQPDG